MWRKFACASALSLLLALAAAPAFAARPVTALTRDPAGLGIRLGTQILRIGDPGPKIGKLLGKPTKTETGPYREAYYDEDGLRVRGNLHTGRVETIALKATPNGFTPMFYFLAGLYWKQAHFTTDTGLGPGATIAQVKARYKQVRVSIQPVGNVTLLEVGGPKHQHVEFVFREGVFQELRLRRI